MNYHDKNREEYECNFRDELLVHRLEEILPTARIKQMGFLILILMDKSAWTIHQLAENTFDLVGKIGDEVETTVDEMGIQQDRLEYVLLTAYQKEQPVDEIHSAFGNDPLGAQARKQDRTLNESGSAQSGSKDTIHEANVPRMLYGSGLFKYLKEVLPVQDDQCFIDDAGNFIVQVDALQVRVIPKGANMYDVETTIGDKMEPTQVQLSHGETVRYVFDLISAVEHVNKSSDKPGDDDEEIETGDAYEVLRELAGELGKPTDIFRNHSLFNLRSGLVMEGQTRPNTTNDIISGLDKHLQKFSTLKNESGERLKTDPAPKAKWFRGHPVSFGGDMCGKTLAYVKNLGAVLVGKNEIPPADSLQLSWDDKGGVVMVPITEQAKRPSWKPFR